MEQMCIILNNYVRYLNDVRYTVPETDNHHAQNVQKSPMPIKQYNMRVATILTFHKCLYLRGRLRLTTARQLSAYM